MTRIAAVAAVLFAMFLTPSVARAGDSGIEIGARIGYAFAAGDRGAPPNGTNEAVGNYVSGQLPLWLDVGYRLDPSLYLGGFFSHGFGFVNTDRQDICRNADVNCSASDTRLGVMGRYHFTIPSAMMPWVGLGVGYEWANYKVSGQTILGAGTIDSSWSGYEFANVQAGADYRVTPQFVVAPFVSVSFGQFRNVTNKTTIGNTTTTTDEDVAQTAIHEWILFGLRAAFMP